MVDGYFALDIYLAIKISTFSFWFILHTGYVGLLKPSISTLVGSLIKEMI